MFPRLSEAYDHLCAVELSDLPLPSEVDHLVGTIRNIIGPYGFIMCPAIDESDIYFNRVSMAPNTRLSDLTQGDVVEFNLERFEKGPAARNLKLHVDNHNG